MLKGPSLKRGFSGCRNVGCGGFGGFGGFGGLGRFRGFDGFILKRFFSFIYSATKGFISSSKLSSGLYLVEG